jgi:hypothetical protein
MFEENADLNRLERASWQHKHACCTLIIWVSVMGLACSLRYLVQSETGGTGRTPVQQPSQGRVKPERFGCALGYTATSAASGACSLALFVSICMTTMLFTDQG